MSSAPKVGMASTSAMVEGEGGVARCVRMEDAGAKHADVEGIAGWVARGWFYTRRGRMRGQMKDGLAGNGNVACWPRGGSREDANAMLGWAGGGGGGQAG